MITLQQIDAALGLIGANRSKLADALDIKATTFNAYFTGKNQISVTVLDEVEAYFKGQGVEFIPDGVRFTPTGMRIFKGNTGFQEFYDDLYLTAKTVGGDICLFNGVSELVIKALGQEKLAEQKERMQKIANNYRYRVIVKEGDNTFFGSDYCEYKWIAEEFFNEQTFFVYGSKVAFVDFTGDVTVHCFDWADMADSQRLLFNLAWDSKAVDPS